jgi:hypothetical protein
LACHAPAVSAQDELCGNGSIDFGEGETCDDGGLCEGGASDGLACATLRRCSDGANIGDVCANELDCGFVCPSDCDGNGSVDVSELVLTLDIGLGRQSVDACPAADPDNNGSVSIDNAVLGVDSALSGCVQVCGEPCPGGECVPQDGDLDLADSCPANCRINRDCADPTPLDVTVRFSAPGDGLSTGRFFLRYPDQSVRIPGSGAESPQVQERFSTPWAGSLTLNDIDYGVRLVAQAELFQVIPPGELFVVTYDRCAGTPDPTAEDFRCTVFDAFDSLANDVTDQTTCTVELP